MIGQRVRRREDPRFLTGRGRYVDDLPLAGARHVRFVRADPAHARIEDVDVSAARTRPGVLAFTAAEIDIAPVAFRGFDPALARPVLADGTVRFSGEILAAVLAETAAEAVDAAETVWAELDPLPVVADSVRARSGETRLFPAHGSNVVLDTGDAAPDADLFAGCARIVEGELESQRIHIAPIEPRASAAIWEAGRLTLWLSTQTPHQDRTALAGALELEPADVRVIAPDVGGGFGGKHIGPEDMLVAWLARHTGRPVRWTETRSEQMVAIGHGRAQRLGYRLGADADGTLRALWLDIVQDAGAYPSLGAILPTLTRSMASGTYRIPRVQARVRSVLTNTTPTGALRGAGRPEATQVLECAMDHLAREIGSDPAQLRRRNLIAADAFPYRTPVDTTYDVGDYVGALDAALEAADYPALREEQARRRGAGDPRLLGIGVSTYVEVTNGLSETEFGAAEIHADGSATVRTGSFAHGQGHETTFAQIVAAELGIDAQRITVRAGDTDEIARGTGTYGSKSVQIGGAAARQAAVEVVDRARELVAERLEADPRDVVLARDRGAFHVAGAPAPALSWAQLAAGLDDDGRLGELCIQTDFIPAQPTYPFGAHVVVVEVDSETGSVQLRQVIAVDDAGTIINPLIADGQVHGGLAAGLAQALFEECGYDADGNPQHANFVTYCIPGAPEFPQFTTIRRQTPTPVNPLGAKGIGESGTIGVTPAARSAVLDALAPLGVTEIGMPASGERVWQAIRDAAASR